jgi:L-fuconolactonase
MLPNPFKIIDPHIHQWDPYNTPHAAAHAVKFLGKFPLLLDRAVRFVNRGALLDSVGLTQHLTAAYLPTQYKKDLGFYAVEQVVHVEAHWYEQKGLGVVNETRFVSGLNFEEHGLKLGAIVATADPRQGNFKKVLAAHREASGKFRGIRKMAAVHADSGIHAWADDAHLYQDKKFLTGFEHLAKENLTFDAWVYSTQLKDLISLAKDFPETQIVLDHFGTPAGLFGSVGKHTAQNKDAREKILQHWQTHIAELAQCPNVWIKMSGLYMPVLGHRYYQQHCHVSKDQILEQMTPLISHVLAHFGTERVMFASNFPMDSVNVELITLLDAMTDIVHGLCPDALPDIFYNNAKQFYQL